MSYIMKKAQNIIDTKSIQFIDGKYIIQSSNGKPHVIHADKMQCKCKGFLKNKDCSHIQAVKMMQESGGGV